MATLVLEVFASISHLMSGGNNRTVQTQTEVQPHLNNEREAMESSDTASPLKPHQNGSALNEITEDKHSHDEVRFYRSMWHTQR